MSGDMMSFPDNWWTFVQQYQFADKEEIYTNGSMLIPSFRVRQMAEHYFGGEVGKTSRYSELFGTPERAARAIANICSYHGSFDCSYGCLADGTVCDCGDYDALLERLRGEGDGLMCEYCENVTKPGTVGKTYYDNGTSYCELAWFSGDPMPTLQVKSDGNWSCVMVPCCPMCGRDLREVAR